MDQRDPAFSPGAPCRSLVVLIRKPLTLPRTAEAVSRLCAEFNVALPATECQLHSGGC